MLRYEFDCWDSRRAKSHNLLDTLDLDFLGLVVTEIHNIYVDDDQ